jgi:hypothetical protein
MSDTEYKWIGWDKPKNIKSRAIREIQVPAKYLKIWKEGTFRFNDGTTQGWTIDQLYDTNDGLFPPYIGFSLCNYQNLALAAAACPLLVLGSGAKSFDFYLDSPNLQTMNGWESFKGYSLDLQRNFCSPCGDQPSQYWVQLQVRLWDKKLNKMRTFAEWDDQAQKYKFHEVIAHKPYHLIWKLKGNWVTDQGLELGNLRIRFTQPNVNSPGSGECLPKGAWLIGNVSPE